MQVLLINPPQSFSKTQTATGVTPPLGLMYLAAVLKQEVQETTILDSIVEGVENIYDIDNDNKCRGLGFDDIISKITSDIDLIGISNLFSLAFPIVLTLAKKIKEKYPEIPIVVGGAHPSATPIETVSESSIDFVIISEGEETMLELVKSIGNYRAIEKIDGLAYKDQSGNPQVNPKTKYIKDLDALPFPARELLELDKYYQTSEAHGPTQQKWTPILSSRGCPYGCTFCTSRLWNRSIRMRSPANVIDEIEECIKKYNITEFHFEDENLTLNKKRVIDICNGIIKKKLKIKWQTPNGIRASVTDSEILDLMKASGCYHITVAPESGSKRILNEVIKKQQNLEKVTDVVEHASKIGLRTAAYFVIGLPGETISDVKLTIKYANKLAKFGLDEVDFSNFVPLPGSELFEKLVNSNKLVLDWSSFASMSDIRRSTSWSEYISSDDLNRIRITAFLKFHITKAIFHPQKVIRSVWNVLRGIEELKTEKVLKSFIKRLKPGYGKSVK
ncbi:MAG: B12-binding domain-containing radical SAM protein [Planctomycetota bacterium]|jgi:magnesium-protoporphyrin IX monomethyl ester (oxidative) cyclase